MGNTIKKIIIVSNDKSALLFSSFHLSDTYKVYSAPSGGVLRYLVKNVRPDLILLDTDLPDANGYEVLENLKNSAKTALIPVILMNTEKNPLDETKSWSLGAADFITKPLSQGDLLGRIGDTLTL